MNEAELVREAQRDPVQFLHLYQRYLDRIFAYLVRETGDRNLAEELTAVTFEKALANLPRYRWRGVSFGAWLYKIARNELRRQHNKGKWLTFLDDGLESGQDVERVVGRRVEIGRTRTAMQTLSDRDQEILRLHFDEELSHPEIATILSCSTRNVAVRLHRAVGRLRKKLAEEPSLPSPLSLTERGSRETN